MSPIPTPETPYTKYMEDENEGGPFRSHSQLPEAPSSKVYSWDTCAGHCPICGQTPYTGHHDMKANSDGETLTVKCYSGSGHSGCGGVWTAEAYAIWKHREAEAKKQKAIEPPPWWKFW